MQHPSLAHRQQEAQTARCLGLQVVQPVRVRVRVQVQGTRGCVLVRQTLASLRGVAGMTPHSTSKGLLRNHNATVTHAARTIRRRFCLCYRLGNLLTSVQEGSGKTSMSVHTVTVQTLCVYVGAWLRC